MVTKKDKFLTKVGDNLISICLTSVIAVLAYGSKMLLDHDKKLALIDQKVTILVHKLAPELETPVYAGRSEYPRLPVPDNPRFPAPENPDITFSISKERHDH